MCPTLVYQHTVPVFWVCPTPVYQHTVPVFRVCHTLCTSTLSLAREPESRMEVCEWQMAAVPFRRELNQLFLSAPWVCLPLVDDLFHSNYHKHLNLYSVSLPRIRHS